MNWYGSFSTIYKLRWR